MNLHFLIAKSEKFIADNSPLILTGIGAAGVLTTAYLTGKASVRAYKVLEANKPMNYQTHSDPELTTQEKFLLTWKLGVPPAASAVVTIAAIIAANRIGLRRTAALAAAYAMSERAATEYKDKVVEKIGKKKAKDVQDEISQDKLKGVQTGHVVINNSEVLMLDTYTMKPFSSTMEKVRKVENDLRELLLNGEKTVTISDWLQGIGLRKTPYSDDFGWNMETGFKLDYTAGLTDDNFPCLVWHFATNPIYKPEPVEEMSFMRAPQFRGNS